MNISHEIPRSPEAAQRIPRTYGMKVIEKFSLKAWTPLHWGYLTITKSLRGINKKIKFSLKAS